MLIGFVTTFTGAVWITCGQPAVGSTSAEAFKPFSRKLWAMVKMNDNRFTNYATKKLQHLFSETI
jgi:hypothetical protein